MARKDCEVCGRHRARWLVEVYSVDSGSRREVRVCGICRWRLWPSPRRKKPVVIVRMLSPIRGDVKRKKARMRQPGGYTR